MKKIIYSVVFLILVITPLITTPIHAYEANDVIGNVSETLRAMNNPNACTVEVPLGSVAADAVRTSTRTDIAIVSGGDFNANLQGGEVTWKDVQAVFKEDRLLAIAEITPFQLREILEVAVSKITLNEEERIDYEISSYDGFPQISGFSFAFNAPNTPGNRISYIRLDDGTVLDLTDNETNLTISSTQFMLLGGYNLPKVDNVIPSEISLSTALADYIALGGTQNLPNNGRIDVLGNRDDGLLTEIPTGVLAIVLIILLVMAITTRKRSVITDRRSK